MGRKHEKNVAVQIGGFQPLEKLPRPPAGLGTYGRKRWKEIGQPLVAHKAIAKGDLLFLEQLCRLYDQQKQLDADIEKTGYTVTDTNGNVKVNPLVTQRNRVTNKIADMLKSCAMTPTDHTSIRPLSDKKEEQKKDAKHVLRVINAERTA